MGTSLQPTGPEAYTRRRELRPVGNHPIKEIWEDNLAIKLHGLLKSRKVEWTSTDVVRVGYVRESLGSASPVILWIGVVPTSLSQKDGTTVAAECLELLKENNISDVDVEIRESLVIRSAGPQLLASTGDQFERDPIADIHEPLTPTLGIPICAEPYPDVEGNGGFFIYEGENSERLLLVTSRHIVFPPDINKNSPFKHSYSTQPHHNVILFGNTAFKKYLESIPAELRSQNFVADYNERRIAAVEGQDSRGANRTRENAQAELDMARRAIKELPVFHEDVLAHWSTPESRILGHVILSPPIGVGDGSEAYTEDWAVVEVDASKVNAANFKGNAIDIGGNLPSMDFAFMMCPNHDNVVGGKFVQIPWRRLLKLRGTIPDEEMRNPIALDEKGSPYLVVTKRGGGTGLTFGYANDVFSYARTYNDDGSASISKEWAILPRLKDANSGSSAFSDKGDSGTVVVDGLGRIGGLITGGAGYGGRIPDLDITYVTPISFLLKRMAEKGLREPTLADYPNDDY